LVGSIAAKVNCGAIELVGERRTGKTMTLAHLASLASGEQLGLLDDARPIDVQLSAANHFVVYTTCRSLGLTGLRYELAPWCRDDLIEYLLSTHPDRLVRRVWRRHADRSHLQRHWRIARLVELGQTVDCRVGLASCTMANKRGAHRYVAPVVA
jgi:hypothetical protein